MAETNRHRFGSGPNNPNWRGGRVIDPRGYVLIRVGKDHPLADVRGYAYEHRLMAEEKEQRRLREGEEVHHRGAKSDNRHEMIDVLPMLKHKEVHRKRTDLKPVDDLNFEVSCACGCGITFLKYDETNRPRSFLPGHNLTHSSPSEDLVVSFLMSSGKSRHLADIVKSTGLTLSSVKAIMTRLRARNMATRTSRGYWRTSEMDNG